MTRVVSGVVLAVSAAAIIWFVPPAGLLAVALVVAGLAFLEYRTLARAVEAPLPFLPALAATLAACAAMALPWVRVSSLLGLIVVAVAVSLIVSGRHGAPLVHGAAAAVLAPVYIGLPLGAVVAIHQMEGRAGVLTLIATVAASDTCQYYAGRTFGRRPLAPIISPKKTIEGAIGGFVLAPLVLVALAQWSLPTVHPGAVWVAGVGIVMAGIAGDLFESTFKRAANMKDSGTLIPGHGGVLDRIDALLFAAPLFHLLLTLT